VLAFLSSRNILTDVASLCRRVAQVRSVSSGAMTHESECLTQVAFLILRVALPCNVGVHRYSSALLGSNSSKP
jgi:hypothetical protein